MIRYLADEEKYLSESLYREAFPEDKDEFVKYYYSYITKNDKILVMEKAGEVCSMLHLNPYRLSVNKSTVDAYYYVAVATKATCRHQGMITLRQAALGRRRESSTLSSKMPSRVGKSCPNVERMPSSTNCTALSSARQSVSPSSRLPVSTLANVSPVPG